MTRKRKEKFTNMENVNEVIMMKVPIDQLRATMAISPVCLGSLPDAISRSVAWQIKTHSAFKSVSDDGEVGNS